MKWRWMPGMRTRNGERILAPIQADLAVVAYVDMGFSHNVSVDKPDWDDPATMGCLVYQVRQAFSGGPVSVFPVKIDGKENFACWHYKHDGKHLTSYGETEVAALLAALEGNGV